MKNRTLWIVIADGEHARFVLVASNGALRTLHVLDSVAAHRKSSDLGTDRPSLVLESATGIRHAIAPRCDLHEMEKVKFARRVAHTMTLASARRAFDAAVLVAPAETLNEILDVLDRETMGKLTGVLRRNLTKVPDHELAAHLSDWVHPGHRRRERREGGVTCER